MCADNPYHQVVLKAGYVNDTAFRAELFRQQGGRKISDSLLALRLNTSTLMHTRLAWRPRTLTDMQVKNKYFLFIIFFLLKNKIEKLKLGTAEVSVCL